MNINYIQTMFSDLLISFPHSEKTTLKVSIQNQAYFRLKKLRPYVLRRGNKWMPDFWCYPIIFDTQSQIKLKQTKLLAVLSDLNFIRRALAATGRITVWLNILINALLVYGWKVITHGAVSNVYTPQPSAGSHFIKLSTDPVLSLNIWRKNISLKTRPGLSSLFMLTQCAVQYVCSRLGSVWSPNMWERHLKVMRRVQQLFSVDEFT